MDKLKSTLINTFEFAARLAKLQTPRGLGFPCIAMFKFTLDNHAAAKSAVHCGRSGKPWNYAGKNYRVTGIKIDGNYLVIRGYPLDIIPERR